MEMIKTTPPSRGQSLIIFGGQVATSQLVMAFMTEMALLPRLLCTIDNGICMEYVQREPITWATRHRLEPQVWKLELLLEPRVWDDEFPQVWCIGRRTLGLTRHE